MPWDPDRYLRFADHRTRPGIELLARIPDIEARSIVDLGCGTGHLTALLAERWPEASVEGMDSSEEMIERARGDQPDLTWSVADITGWEPDEPVDLLFSNATLHWLDDHHDLFPRLRSYLGESGVMAVQMPDNWWTPTHRIPADLFEEGGWPEAVSQVLLRDRLSPLASYDQWLQPAEVDMWRTTYYQRLRGENPVWTWVTGSLLRPVLAALEGADLDRFIETCRARYLEAFPPGPDGVTLLPFSRLFFVARAA